MRFLRLTMKEINWASILHDSQYTGVRIAALGVAIGSIGFPIALFGFMFLGASICVVGLSTVLTGIAVNFAHMRDRK